MKSQFRNREGRIDSSKIEREVQKFFQCNQKSRLKIYFYQINNLLFSEAVETFRYFESEERKDQYQVRTIGKLILGRGFFSKDITTYILEVSPKPQKNNH